MTQHHQVAQMENITETEPSITHGTSRHIRDRPIQRYVWKMVPPHGLEPRTY